MANQGNIPSQADPNVLMKHIMAFFGSKYLFTATELGIFELLGDGPRSADKLASEIGAETHHLTAVLNALAALNLLEKQGDHFANTPLTDQFLAGKTPADMRPIIKMFDHLMYPRIGSLARDLVENFAQVDSVMAPSFSDYDQRVLSEGVHAITMGAAQQLPHVYDFSQHDRLLDVGGGTGSFLVPLMRQYDHLRAGLIEIPRVVELAEEYLATTPYLDRVTLYPGDVFVDPIPTAEYDVLLMANFLHVFSPDQNIQMLDHVRSDAQLGTRLLATSFWMDETGTQPLAGALMGGIFMNFTKGDSRTYRVVEVREWLENTGWKFVDHTPLAGPQSLIIAEAV